jgi:two-component system response regulator LytT
MILNCIAIDDEPPALNLLVRFIEQTPSLKLIGSASNAIDGLRMVSEQHIDLIFLDIQMPDLSGIELARILSARNAGQPPMIIFTTAFDQFALEGYKLDVVDYLLKPFGYEEFMRGANKALNLSRFKTNRTEPVNQEDEYIYVKVEYQTVKIACNNISYIEGLKDYAKIHMINTEKSILSLITLKALEEKLPKDRFMRIHRSFIISLDKVTSVTKNSIYIDKFMIPVSDQYKDIFSNFITNWK